MKNKIINTFDKIYVDDVLKAKTADFLYEKIQSNHKVSKPFFTKRLVASFATVFAVILCAVHFSGLYFSADTYIDMDVNPSIELSVNTFGRVISAKAYNPDGDTMLNNVNIKHKTYNQAVPILVEYMSQNNYLNNDSLVSVTVQSQNKTEEENLLSQINNLISSKLETLQKSPKIEVFTVDYEVKQSSTINNVTPAKYIAIEDLMEADPTITFNSCRGRSVRDIREMTDMHHGMRIQNSTVENSPVDSNNSTAQDEYNGQRMRRGMHCHE